MLLYVPRGVSLVYGDLLKGPFRSGLQLQLFHFPSVLNIVPLVSFRFIFSLFLDLGHPAVLKNIVWHEMSTNEMPSPVLVWPWAFTNRTFGRFLGT